MSRKLIIITTIFMAITLIVLITVQSIWLKNALNIKEEHLDQLVYKALIEATRHVEQQEAQQLIRNEIFNHRDSTSNSIQDSSTFFLDTIVLKKGELGNDTNSIHSFRFSHRSSDGSYRASIDIESNMNGTEKNDFLIDKEFKKRFSDKREFVDQLVAKMFALSPKIEDRLSRTILEKSISEYLKSNGIELNYEYCVYNDEKKKIFGSPEYEVTKKVKYYSVKLFPRDFFKNTGELVLWFPKREKYIYASLGIMGGISILFTVLLITTFSFTLYIIFRQKKLSEMKTDFVNNMTHELKTPISTISLASQMLNDKEIPFEEKNLNRIANIISQETGRLGFQVERVLQTARIEQNKVKLNFEEVDLNDLIEKVASNFIIQVENKGGMLIPSLHAENSNVWADDVHLGNVVSNLLDNAIKFTPEGPEIFIESINKKDKIIFTVRDNGIGISKSNQKKIFDKFYRVSTGNVHNVKGFGLGLSYVKKIVEMHEGQIKVDSELGIGSAFIISLPLNRKSNGEN